MIMLQQMEDLITQTLDFVSTTPRLIPADGSGFDPWFRLTHWLWLGVGLWLGATMNLLLQLIILKRESFPDGIKYPILGMALILLVLGSLSIFHGYNSASKNRFVWTEGSLQVAVVVQHDTQWGSTPMRDGERDSVVIAEVQRPSGIETHSMVFFNESAHTALPLGTKVQVVTHDASPIVLFPIEQGIRLIPR